MCGLAGMFAYGPAARPVDRNRLLTVREKMAHRGPDGAGLWLSEDQRVGLAFRRLAILDLSDAGAQPMGSADGRLQLVFNGEIYNFRELRQMLQGEGAVFRSRSDTEVLLHLYLRRGKAMCRLLRGMYAFAIWDSLEGALFLARDPFGIKPLYIHDDGQTLSFASEVKALLAGGASGGRANPDGLADYWVWGHICEPRTIAAGIESLPPGEWLVLKRHAAPERGRFTSLQGLLAGEDGSPGRDLRAVLSDTVQHHLVSDVPVGVFLSAGIDSRVLAILAAEHRARIRTLTLGFEEFRETPDDEVPIAEATAKKIGADHQTVWITKREFEQAFDQYMADMDQPTIDGLNVWLVSAQARKLGLKVALSGIGGDELFGGYPSFRQVPRMRRLAAPFSRIPGLGRMVRKLTAKWGLSGSSLSWPKLASVLEYGGTWGGSYLLRRAVRMPWEIGSDYDAATLAQIPSNLRSDHSRVTWLEMSHYLKNQLLRDCDWAGMAHSVEIRVPFVDTHVARAVGQQAEAGRPWRKADLATILSRVDASGLRRSKTGFVVPVRNWLEGSSRERQPRLRDWQELVCEMFLKESRIGGYVGPARRLVLWSPETATPGGVQNYMRSIADLLSHVAAAPARTPGLLSLNDAEADLAREMSASRLVLHGAGRSKPAFVYSALTDGTATDVVVGHLHLAPLACFARALGLIRRYYVVLHGIEAWDRATFLERLALGRATRVISTTQFTANECAKANELPLDRFAIIALCSRDETEEPDESFRLDGGWPLLFVGRLANTERYKGLDNLIEAVAALRSRHVPAKIHVIGSGDDMAYYRAAADRAGLGDAGIAMHGMVSAGQLAAAYRQARVFAMPSKKEGFGIVFLEAMRHGVPCIGGEHGGIPEVFEKGREGELVTHGDVAALTEKLFHLYANPAYAAALGAAGQARWLRDYTPAKFQERWMSLLNAGRRSALPTKLTTRPEQLPASAAA